MANVVFNISKGRVVEYYNRVKSNDPANAVLVLVPLETTGLVADATMIDYDNLSDLLAGATNEQTTMGRKVLTDADLVALPAPDDSANVYLIALPTTVWTAATGNPISKIAVCYDSDSTGGADTAIIPLTLFDFSITPDGSDVQMTAGNFFQAA